MTNDARPPGLPQSVLILGGVLVLLALLLIIGLIARLSQLWRF